MRGAPQRQGLERQRWGGGSLLALLPAGVFNGMVAVLGRIVAGWLRRAVEAKGTEGGQVPGHGEDSPPAPAEPLQARLLQAQT